MGETVRFGVSMDSEMVELLDRFTIEQGHENRSETIRSLVRQALVETNSGDADPEIIGTVTLLYHHSTRLPRVLVENYPSVQITANIQLHADTDIRIKVLVVRGRGSEVHAWAQKLLSSKKIIGKLAVTATDELFKELL